MSDPTLFDYSMIKGTVDAILFQNTDNFYTVLKVDTIESNEKFDSMPTVVGFLPNVVEGDVYTFKGQVVQHPRYGKQLKAETFEKELPQTKEAIISYLSSDLFKGIGKKTAQNIVNTLGENAINDILTHPEILESVPSLPKKKQKQIADQINANQESEKIMIRLHDLGFGPKLSMAIYQFYMGDTLNVLDKNPYQLVYDIKGIGFNKADQLARNVGIEPHSPERLKAALLFTLEEECIKQGHTYLPRTIVLNVFNACWLSKCFSSIDIACSKYAIASSKFSFFIYVAKPRLYIPSTCCESIERTLFNCLIASSNISS